MKYDLSKMIYYHGEEECPYGRGDGGKPYWWTYEMTYVESCKRQCFSQKQLDGGYPKHIVGILKHVADKYSFSDNWEKYLEDYLNGHAFPTKYDLSGMSYFHGEAKCPYERYSRENDLWQREAELVADCEAKGLSQKQFELKAAASGKTGGTDRP